MGVALQWEGWESIPVYIPSLVRPVLWKTIRKVLPTLPNDPIRTQIVSQSVV
jgi:hypothetical protein